MTIDFGDNDVFISDLGEACTLPDGSVVEVFLDSPDEETLNNRVISSDAMITIKTEIAKNLSENQIIIVNNKQYKIKFKKRIDDGFFSQIFLEDVSND